MPRASKNNPISKDELERLEKELYSLISSLNNDSLMQFMKDFLSDEERIMFSKRLELYKLIQQDIDARIISASLSISYETVRIHKTKRLLHGESFHKAISQALKKKNNDKLLSDIGNVVKTTLSAPDKMKKRQLVDDIFGFNPSRRK